MDAVITKETQSQILKRSGKSRIVLRLPESLHRAVADEAARENQSINQFCVEWLGLAVNSGREFRGEPPLTFSPPENNS